MYVDMNTCPVQMSSLLLSVPCVDAPSRVRVLERSAHLRRGLFYGGIVIVLSGASCLYFAIPTLLAWDALIYKKNTG